MKRIVNKKYFNSLGCLLEMTVRNVPVSGISACTAAPHAKHINYLYPIPDPQMKIREGLYTQNEAYR